MVLTIGQPRICAVRVCAKKLRVDERVENVFAQRVIHAAESSDLRRREAQSRHFNELSTEPFNRAMHNTSPAETALLASPQPASGWNSWEDVDGRLTAY
jgi:hypothetical protein